MKDVYLNLLILYHPRSCIIAKSEEMANSDIYVTISKVADT